MSASPTPDQLALLADVKAGYVCHYEETVEFVGRSINTNPNAARRRCTEEIRELRDAGWVSLAPGRYDDTSYDWQITAAGEAVLAAGEVVTA